MCTIIANILTYIYKHSSMFVRLNILPLVVIIITSIFGGSNKSSKKTKELKSNLHEKTKILPIYTKLFGVWINFNENL